MHAAVHSCQARRRDSPSGRLRPTEHGEDHLTRSVGRHRRRALSAAVTVSPLNLRVAFLAPTPSLLFSRRSPPSLVLSPPSLPLPLSSSRHLPPPISSSSSYPRPLLLRLSCQPICCGRHPSACITYISGICIIISRPSLCGYLFADVLMGAPIGWASAALSTKQPVCIRLRPKTARDGGGGGGAVACYWDGGSEPLTLAEMGRRMAEHMGDPARRVTAEKLDVEFAVPDSTHSVFVDLPGIQVGSRPQQAGRQTGRLAAQTDSLTRGTID
eukprot:GHVU01024626.1.p1 GENE.GHVU01024626.1~~GHVU01024626.1.p1  ORF type:complete len:271 (+),score=15.29 GHVU01024626.1:319-1131(+)